MGKSVGIHKNITEKERNSSNVSHININGSPTMTPTNEPGAMSLGFSPDDSDLEHSLHPAWDVNDPQVWADIFGSTPRSDTGVTGSLIQSADGVVMGNYFPSVVPQQLQRIVEESTTQKISDAETYGPRFCQLFRMFDKTRERPIDTNRHLMSLCTEYLVPFCRWARENEAQTARIRAILLDHDYLRCEARNGIVMVLIYVFASIKAFDKPRLDMFLSLQDYETGLAIANKFSLKIYNDPYLYLLFLKLSISGLIDAGAIPDNERQNQPKKHRVHDENREEILAFEKLQHMLVHLLDSGNNQRARQLVAQITTHWQQRAKFIRNRRFISAVQVIGEDPAVAAFLNQTFAQRTNFGVAPISYAELEKRHPRRHDDEQNLQAITVNSAVSSMGNTSPKVPLLPIKSNSSNSIGSVVVEHSSNKSFTTSEDLAFYESFSSTSTSSKRKAKQQPKSTNLNQASVANKPLIPPTSSSHLSTTAPVPTAECEKEDWYQAFHGDVDDQRTTKLARNSFSARSPFGTSTFKPVPTYRLLRTSVNQWQVQACLIFDVPSMLSYIQGDAPHSTIFLVDEMLLLKSLQTAATAENSTLYCPQLTTCCTEGVVTLQRELLTRGALVSSWCPGEYDQLKILCQQWQQFQLTDLGSTQASTSLGKYWSAQRNPADVATVVSPLALVFEVKYLVGVVVRAAPSLGLNLDVWCIVYPTELQPPIVSRFLNGENIQERESPVSFVEFLSRFFPQLVPLQSSTLSRDRPLLLSYYAHDIHVSASSRDANPVFNLPLGQVPPPPRQDVRCYRAMGSLHVPSTEVLSRLTEGKVFHDFVIEAV